MKSLKILDAETLYYSQICILVKLLHRHEYTKRLLVKCLEENNSQQLDLYEDIKQISTKLSLDLNYVIYYPDKTREILIKKYLNDTEDKQMVDEITELLENFNYENKKKLINLIKLSVVNNGLINSNSWKFLI